MHYQQEVGQRLLQGGFRQLLQAVPKSVLGAIASLGFIALNVAVLSRALARDPMFNIRLEWQALMRSLYSSSNSSGSSNRLPK